jgi:hypothetical protein
MKLKRRKKMGNRKGTSLMNNGMPKADGQTEGTKKDD